MKKNSKNKRAPPKKGARAKKSTGTTMEDATKEERTAVKKTIGTEEDPSVNLERGKQKKAKEKEKEPKKPEKTPKQTTGSDEQAKEKKKSEIENKKSNVQKRPSTIMRKQASKDEKKKGKKKEKKRVDTKEMTAEEKPKSKSSTVKSPSGIKSNKDTVVTSAKLIFDDRLEEGSGPTDVKKRKAAKDWATAIFDKGVDAVVQEFKAISAIDIPAEKYKTCTENPDLNRYDNTFCLDETRVKTRTDEYIHANYVGTEERPKQFIATQGPLSNTVDRFWQMVFSEGCEVIVMLCDPVEKGQEKCFKYWPSEFREKFTYGGVTITNNGMMELDAAKPVQVAVTLLTLTKDEKSSMVRHFHWKAWPDHSVPTSYIAPSKLLGAIKGSVKPIVIHCSAGVGRTGTLLLIALAQEGLMREGFQGIKELLLKIREQRAHCVQNEMQYLYAHRCLIEYYVSKDIVGKEMIEKFCKDYESFIAENKKKKKKTKDAAKDIESPAM